MKQIEYFLDFYKSLNTPGMVLFWLIVVLFFFLFFSLIAVLLKNQELRKIIIKMRTEEKKNNVEDKTIEEQVKNETQENQEDITFSDIKIREFNLTVKNKVYKSFLLFIAFDLVIISLIVGM